MGVRGKLLDAYLTLAAYPEVAGVLAALKARGARLAILTNGDPEMIDAAVRSSGLGGMLDAVVTVHEAGVFKPDKRVYKLATERFDLAPGDISFQSSNRWDIAGAKVFGMRCVWINRSGAPDEYPDMAPDHIVRDLTALTEIS